MAKPGYRHTQVGWVILVSMTVALIIVLASMLAAGMISIAMVATAVLALSMLVFGWLSVEVDGGELRARFGVGLIVKRVALADVRTFSVVTNPWYWGWGIRLYPGGWLYNVSGYEAVELVLQDGKRCRIGTDDPRGLSEAIREVLGDPTPVSPHEPAARPRTASRVAYAVLVLVLVAVAGTVVALVSVSASPPQIMLTSTNISVKSGFYGVDIPLQNVTAVSLEPSLPRILRRTNGYAGGGSLRGHFDVEGLGNGQLFVETRRPPYIFVRTASEFFFVNHDDPARTQELYRALADGWKKGRPQ